MTAIFAFSGSAWPANLNSIHQNPSTHPTPTHPLYLKEYYVFVRQMPSMLETETFMIRMQPVSFWETSLQGYICQDCMQLQLHIVEFIVHTTHYTEHSSHCTDYTSLHIAQCNAHCILHTTLNVKWWMSVKDFNILDFSTITIDQIFKILNSKRSALTTVCKGWQKLNLKERLKISILIHDDEYQAVYDIYALSRLWGNQIFESLGLTRHSSSIQTHGRM